MVQTKVVLISLIESLVQSDRDLERTTWHLQAQEEEMSFKSKKLLQEKYMRTLYICWENWSRSVRL